MPYILDAGDEYFTFSGKRNVLISERVIFDYVLVYVKEGSSEITVAGRSYLCQTGDVYLFRPKIPHSTVVFGEIYHQPHIHFSIEPYKDQIKTFIPFVPLEELPRELHYLFCDDVIDDYLGLSFPSRFTPTDSKETERLLMETIHEFLKHTEFLSGISASACLTRLLVHLARDLHNAELQNRSPVSLKLAEIKSFIEINYAKDITLELLEQKFYISRYYLVSQFAAEFGVSPIKYRNLLRFEKAKALLRYPNNRVCDVSDMLGFSSPQSFSRAFFNAVGQSPQKYREETHLKDHALS